MTVTIDLKGRGISLAELDEDERTLLETLKQRADRAPPWHEFANFWMKLVGSFTMAEAYPGLVCRTTETRSRRSFAPGSRRAASSAKPRACPRTC